LQDKPYQQAKHTEDEKEWQTEDVDDGPEALSAAPHFCVRPEAGSGRAAATGLMQIDR